MQLLYSISGRYAVSDMPEVYANALQYLKWSHLSGFYLDQTMSLTRAKLAIF